ncbi:hypothetical protein [Methylophilus sp. Leaf414]|uniref:hypothetical protein n=1 Tax=Methylophilus sp. Leaf414 TaxID=1736371 RepID=UPI0012E3B1CE|nr:hypothetical protein [Methylophilus sp. Leaf414]
MTETYRSEINKWLLDMFGTVDTIVMEQENMIVMSPEAIRKIRSHVKLQTELRDQLVHDVINGTGACKPIGFFKTGR